jgi:hypothetical protein
MSPGGVDEGDPCSTGAWTGCRFDHPEPCLTGPGQGGSQVSDFQCDVVDAGTVRVHEPAQRALVADGLQQFDAACPRRNERNTHSLMGQNLAAGDGEAESSGVQILGRREAPHDHGQVADAGARAHTPPAVTGHTTTGGR